MLPTPTPIPNTPIGVTEWEFISAVEVSRISAESGFDLNLVVVGLVVLAIALACLALAGPHRKE